MDKKEKKDASKLIGSLCFLETKLKLFFIPPLLMHGGLFLGISLGPIALVKSFGAALTDSIEIPEQCYNLK